MVPRSSPDHPVLPYDVWTHVVSFLVPADYEAATSFGSWEHIRYKRTLTALARVSKALHDVAIRRLYRDLVFPPLKASPHTYDPSSRRRTLESFPADVPWSLILNSRANSFPKQLQQASSKGPRSRRPDVEVVPIGCRFPNLHTVHLWQSSSYVSFLSDLLQHVASRTNPATLVLHATRRNDIGDVPPVPGVFLLYDVDRLFASWSALERVVVREALSITGLAGRSGEAMLRHECPALKSFEYVFSASGKTEPTSVRFWDGLPSLVSSFSTARGVSVDILVLGSRLWREHSALKADLERVVEHAVEERRPVEGLVVVDGVDIQGVPVTLTWDARGE